MVGLFDVLEHIDDDDAVLAAARRMLRPGGRLVVTVPRHPFLWSHLDALVDHRRRYRASDLLAKVRRPASRCVRSSATARCCCR